MSLAQYDVLTHLDAIEAELTPDVPFYVLHLIRACRALLAERDALRQVQGRRAH